MNGQAPKRIGGLGIVHDGKIGAVRRFVPSRPRPRIAMMVEDELPAMMKPQQPTQFTSPATPKDYFTMDIEEVSESIPADSDLLKKLMGYFEQKGASAADMEDFVRLWDRIHKPQSAMDNRRRRRVFDTSATESRAKILPDYDRLGSR